MNGTISPSLTKAVTHVVTASALSEKSILAQKDKIPLMTPDWVRAIWQDNQEGLVDATDSRYVKYTCPVFYNIKICMSQLTNVRKSALKAAVESLGNA